MKSKRRSNGGAKKVFSTGGEIVFCGDAENAEGVLSTFRVISEPNILVQGNLFSPDDTKLDSVFGAYALRKSRNQISKMIRGNTIAHLYPKDLQHLTIPVPPMEVQHEIVALLDSHEDLIRAETQKWVLLKTLKDVLLHEVFSLD